MLSHLSILQNGSLWLNLYDESLVEEIKSWFENLKGDNIRFMKPKFNIGPFLGVFPNAMDMFMSNDGESYATVTFLFDYYEKSRFRSWKDWFVLPEDKYKMEVTRIERIS